MGFNRDKNAVSANMDTARGQKRRKIGLIFGAFALAVVSFFSGSFAVWFALDEEIRTLIKVKNTIDREYYKDVDDEEFYGAIFDAVNAQLDPYSYYMNPDEYTQAANDLAGSRIGIGVSFNLKEIETSGKISIARVCGNSPAEGVGMRAGDCIVGLGRTETTFTACEDYDEFTAFLAEFGEGEPFYLQIKRGEEILAFRLTRESYVESYVFYRSSTTAYSFTGEDALDLTERGLPLAALPDDTAYVRLVRFGGAAVKEFETTMSVFKREGKKNLVLDLRGNGGGYVNTMQGIASYLCKNTQEKNPVVMIADYGEGKKEYYHAGGNYYADYFASDSRLCVLADSSSASASEALLGVMVDYGGTSYGDICLFERNGVTKTYGKGIMQSSFRLSLKGDVIKLTTAEIRWPVTEYSIHGRGVLPEDGTKTVEEGLTDEEELILAIEKLFSEN